MYSNFIFLDQFLFELLCKHTHTQTHTHTRMHTHTHGCTHTHTHTHGCTHTHTHTHTHSDEYSIVVFSKNKTIINNSWRLHRITQKCEKNCSFLPNEQTPHFTFLNCSTETNIAHYNFLYKELATTSTTLDTKIFRDAKACKIKNMNEPNIHWRMWVYV